jgi:Zn-finger nucleic acid-binding protein
MLMDAKSLRCPQCGAAARSGAPRCAYCRARLATVACPGCFSLVLADAAFCPQCGARRDRQEAPSDARCPGCRNGMQALTLGPVTLLECAACDGLWIDAEAFERICADRESQAAVLHKDEARRDIREQRVSYRPCVRCGTMMHRVNFARLSGAILDVCKTHGTFLDRGELQDVVRFIQNGGLERARQRQLEDLKEQERSLRAQEVRLQGERRGTAPWDGWHQTGSGFVDLLALFSDD